MLKGKTIRVEAIWDEEAQVWVATSDDVPGLITEADTSEQLIEKLQVMIPELLQANGLINENDPSDIPLHLLSKRTEMIKSRVNWPYGEWSVKASRFTEMLLSSKQE